MKANFFIVGAAKSGTTSLYKYLNQHPDIYFSPIKEPNYFSTDIEIDKFSSVYKKNTFLDTELYFEGKRLPELQLSFVRDENQYQRLFENVTKEKVLAEASTSYLYSLEAAQNIYDYNSDAKVLMVLRNPISRAYSHYHMALRYGHVSLGFREELEKDISKLEKGWGISELFVELGLYAEQIKRYQDIFNEENIKIVLFEDFKSNPAKVVRECFQFLGIEDVIVDCSEKHNEKSIPKTPTLNRFLTRTGAKNLIKSVLPVKAQNVVKNLIFKDSDIGYSRSDFLFLLDYYEKDIKKTARLINRDLSAWLEY